MMGRYIVGFGPGRANDGNEAPEVRAANAARHDAVEVPAADHFGGLLGGRRDADGFTIPFQPWLVGSVAMPALHGGVAAAGLISAAGAVLESMPTGQERALQPVSLTLQFLRAGLAEETRFVARCVKSWARAVYVEAAVTRRTGRRRIATMQALCA